MKDLHSMTDSEIRKYQTELKNKAHDLQKKIETRKKYLMEIKGSNAPTNHDKELSDLKKELKNTQIEAIMIKEYQKPLSVKNANQTEIPENTVASEQAKNAISSADNAQHMRSFRVSYLDPKSQADETQFDVHDADFVTMFNELVGQFGSFCGENYGDDPCWIVEIEEVPYERGCEAIFRAF